MSDFANSNSRIARAHLRLLATTDVHASMTGWDALQNRMNTAIGLDKLAITIREARETAPGETLLFDNGDILQGTAEADICADPDNETTHPWPAIALALGYDAVGLGNHDFDFGLEYLEGIVDRLTPPVLCSSLRSGQIQGVQSSMVIPMQLMCDDGMTRLVSVGVFSVLPPQTLIWNHKKLSGRIAFDNGLDAARRAVKHLCEEGAELIIALSHSGLSSQTDAEAENFSAQLASNLPNIDAMIMGHTHRRFPGEDHGIGQIAHDANGTISGVPAVMPGFAAQSLGVIDLLLECVDGRWHVENHTVALHPAAHSDTDAAISDLAAPAIAATSKIMETPISTTQHHIHSYFNALQSGTEHSLVARAMIRVIAERVRDISQSQSQLPLIASVSSSAVGGHGGVTNFIDIPKGPVLERHLAMICPYQNDIWAAVLTGADLWNWAERSAVYFGAQPGTQSLLANPGAPFFSFDSLVGLETVIDPFVPARYDVTGGLIDPNASRIQTLRFNGQDVATDAEFLVAMTSYRGAGGGSFPGLETADTILRTEVDLAQAIREDLKIVPLGHDPSQTAWRFVSGLYQQVVIETSPNAANHLEDIASFEPKPIGLTENGFLQIQVTI